MDIVSATDMIGGCERTLRNFRSDVEKYHADWFQMACNLASGLNTEPSIPRVCGRQTHRNNHPAESPEQYYKRTITIPFLG